MDEVPDPRIGEVLDERYRLVARLGVGGMATVYRAVAVDDGTEVAIKLLHESFAAQTDFVLRFKREAAAMARIDHPNLIRVVGSGMSGSMPYLVLEYLHGHSLEQELLRGTPSAERSVDIARQILAGMDEAHRNDVVHRDLKPENVLLLDGRKGDAVKVFDFGLARITGADEPSLKLTVTGTTMGTPVYMSPEQSHGSSVDSRSDLYSVGVILYQLLVGRPPFEADSMLAVLRMHVDEPPPPPRVRAPHISKALERVLLRALEKTPERRWQTAKEFGAALAATVEGSKTTGLPAPPDPMAASKRTQDAPTPPPSSSPHVTAIARPRSQPARHVPADQVDGLAHETTHELDPLRRRPRRSGRLGILLLLLLAGGAVWAWFDPVIQADVVARVRRVLSSLEETPPKKKPANPTPEKKGRAGKTAK